MSQEKFTDAEFIKKYDHICDYIISVLDSENPDLEVDYSDNIININAEQGQFVVSRQVPLHEIWLSSPISGPSHFFYNGQEWVSRDGEILFTILSNELSIKLINQ